MARKDIIIMSTKELKRLPVIHNVINKQITQREAAEILGLCDRQIRRIATRVKTGGEETLMHKSRGRPSHAAKPLKFKDKVLRLCKTRYKGFNPTFAAEKLFEIDKVKIHKETLRLWFIEADIAYKMRKGVKHRSWRPRKECYGQMVQLDGSHHDWFEGRGSKCVLMGYIDDATGYYFGKFYDFEGTIPAMDSFRSYIKKHGIPQSIYLDKHSTYKSMKKLTIEEELNNIRSLSQFERILTELRVDIIHANSPQAKGRVERSFGTHQDRLVKEMRLAGIRTVKKANRFLSSYYIPKHNQKFSIPAKRKVNLHRPAPKGFELCRIFSIKNKASLRNDFTIRYNNQFYQILDSIRADRVNIEEHLNGKLYMYHKGRHLSYKAIDKLPPRPKNAPKAPKQRYIIPKDHPWRKFRFKKCA